MNETLQEFVDSRGVTLRTDRAAGVIRGVKILGPQSRNGRSYLPEALAAAAPLYEEAKVNVNHPKGDPLAPRDYQDRIGVIRHVVVRPEGLFGDFHFNPKHTLAEQLLWDAEHAPENVGFSHNVQARTARRGDQVVVEAITKVQSVDLVADPATTRGLFESASLSGLSLDELRQARPDLVEEILRPQAATLARLEAELGRLHALESAAEKRQTARRLLAEFQLPDPDTSDPIQRSIVSPAFVESLLAASDESSMRALIEERARLVRSLRAQAAGLGDHLGRPMSREQRLADSAAVGDAKQFVEAIS
jgi:hypothetical protein